MASFFEKLKKGMGVDETAGEKLADEPEKEPEKSKEPPEIREKIPEKQKKKTRQVAQKKEPVSEKTEIKTAAEKDETEEKEEAIREEKAEKPQTQKQETEKKEKWSSFSKDAEGQLAVDVYQTEDLLVIQSAIAGVKPDSIDISIEGDMVTIRGSREKPQEEEETNYFYQECFWGPFSRQIILSVEVDPSRTEASLKDGILTIRIPRIERDRKRKILVRG